MKFGDLFLGPIDLYEPTHDDYVYVVDPKSIDRLGPATPEQRAEVANSLGRKVLNAIVTAVAMTLVGLVLMGAGIYIGATDPDTWTQLPFTPEPSGERAEPEEGAR